MRFLVSAVAAAVCIPAASTAQAPAPTVHSPQNIPASPTSADCPQATSVHAWDRGKEVRPQKLNELPDANAYSAVLRRIGGCEVPIIVRYGVSGGR